MPNHPNGKAMTSPPRLTHCMMHVADLERAITFYEQALHFVIVDRHRYEGHDLAYLRDRARLGISVLRSRISRRNLPASPGSVFVLTPSSPMSPMAYCRPGISISTTPTATRSNSWKRRDDIQCRRSTMGLQINEENCSDEHVSRD
jgi:hypothetical protein